MKSDFSKRWLEQSRACRYTPAQLREKFPFLFLCTESGNMEGGKLAALWEILRALPELPFDYREKGLPTVTYMGVIDEVMPELTGFFQELIAHQIGPKHLDNLKNIDENFLCIFRFFCVQLGWANMTGKPARFLRPQALDEYLARQQKEALPPAAALPLFGPAA